MWTTAKNETWDKNAEKWGGRKQQREPFNLRDDSRELFTLRWKMTAQRTAYIERGGENRQNCLSWGGGENRENYLLWGGRWEQTALFTLRSSGTDSFLCSMALRWEMSTRIEQRTNFFSSCRSCMRWPQWLRSWGLQHTNTHMLCKAAVTHPAHHHTHAVSN